jgi:hypothetical protein
MEETVSDKPAFPYTNATTGPYVLSISNTDATPFPWEQRIPADLVPAPPLNREQRRRAQRKKR